MHGLMLTSNIWRLTLSKLFVSTLIMIVTTCYIPQVAAVSNQSVVYEGINIAGAEFNRKRKQAKHFKDYLWPTDKNLSQMKAFGFNTVRVPFAWERMQPMNFNPLSAQEVKELDRIVHKCHMLGLNIVIDPHNYGAYKGKILKPNKLDIDTFKDFWTKLASRYGNYPNVIFGLMNEPHKQSARQWAVFAQAGIDAIRNAGAEQLILVPGTRWSGMHSWLKGGENSNASALLNLLDPLDNYAYEMHQYFDYDSSGTHNNLEQKCIKSSKIIAKFERTTKWLKSHNKKAFLGEFGAQENKSCITALRDVMEFIYANSNEWVGWTYWTASDWMVKYSYNLFGSVGSTNQRKKIIKQYLN